MLYARIELGKAVEYPITLEALKARYPEYTEGLALPEGWVVLDFEPGFTADPTRYHYEETQPLPSLDPGLWLRQFSVRPLTAAELAARAAWDREIDSLRN